MNQQEVLNENQHYDFTFAGRDGIYALDWEILGIKGTIDSMQETRDHEIKGNVTFVSTRPTSAGHLKGNLKLNLTSSTSRNQIAKSLKQRDADLDWDKIIEQFCMSVLQNFKQGNPAVLLNDDNASDDGEEGIAYLIEPLVQRDNPTLIYGPGSAGKSWLAQYLAVISDEGLSGAGFAVSKVNVLYLDWETDERELNTRVRMIRRGLGLSTSSGIWYRSMRLGLDQDKEEVRKEIITKGIGLVVIDSIGAACAGEPEDAKTVLAMFGALRSLGVSSICVDHVNKEGHLFGTVYKTNASRQVFEVKKDQQPEDDKLMLGLIHKKANNSKLRNVIGLQFVFGDNFMKVERKDIRNTALEDQMRVSDQIENFLHHQPDGKATPRDIADGIDKSENHIKKELSANSNGKGSNRFMNIGNGYYGVVYKGEDIWSL